VTRRRTAALDGRLLAPCEGVEAVARKLVRCDITAEVTGLCARGHQISDDALESRLGSGDGLTSMQKRREFSVMVPAALVRSNPRIKLSTQHVRGLNARR